ncbi:Dabb family protein [Castellaniella sp. S9]|uniref:Dabb family protein n=1 Tax=Castellaniella sp. S9 TaxID=2993652 RepID=UPI0022B5CCFD|nr:Dabb family protein [Castellaniella sp. S9]
MFHHIVMLSLREPLSQEDHEEIDGECALLLRELPGILSLRFVRNRSDRSLAYTHAFVSSFVDEAAHDLYQQTPLHAPLKQKVKDIADHLVVLDYET